MAKTGSKKQLNHIQGLAGPLMASSEEIRTINTPVPGGALVYNGETRELKVMPEKGPASQALDHRHPYTHAPLFHTHMHGVNEPWLVSNPRLWYLDDLKYHPELVALDGSAISEEAAKYLSQIYPGTKLLTEPIVKHQGDSFVNGDLKMSATSWMSVYAPGNLFKEEVTIANMANVADQWLANTTTEQVISIEFTHDTDLRPEEYWLMPAAGTPEAIVKRRPTPKDWFLEGSKDGTSWDILDMHVDEPDENWQPCTLRVFPIETTNTYKYLQLHITAWNGTEETLEPGLRRFWVFGRQEGSFHLPNVASPDPAFAWVVPLQNENVSMKNEDIGDMGYTAILPQNLPSYRLPTWGQQVKREKYPELFAAIGWKYDHTYMGHLSVSDGGLSQSSGAPAEDLWSTDATADPVILEYTPITPCMLGWYQFTFITGVTSPNSWTLEGFIDDDWEVISQVNDAIPNETFILDTTTTEKQYTKYRWTFESMDEALIQVKCGAHIADHFYIPDRDNGEDGSTSYIVAMHQAHDLTPEIIQRLQKDMADLAASQANLTHQVQDLIPNLNKE